MVVDLVDLSRRDPALLHNRKRRSPATEPANSWRRCGKQRRQDQPAPAELSEIPQLAGVAGGGARDPSGELAAAATPGRGFRALGRAWPGGAALAVPDAVVRLASQLDPAGSAIPGLPCPPSSALASCVLGPCVALGC